LKERSTRNTSLKIITFLGFVASLIAIFAFITGKNLPDVLRTEHGDSESIGSKESDSSKALEEPRDQPSTTKAPEALTDKNDNERDPGSQSDQTPQASEDLKDQPRTGTEGGADAELVEVVIYHPTTVNPSSLTINGETPSIVKRSTVFTKLKLPKGKHVISLTGTISCNKTVIINESNVSIFPCR